MNGAIRIAFLFVANLLPLFTVCQTAPVVILSPALQGSRATRSGCSVLYCREKAVPETDDPIRPEIRFNANMPDETGKPAPNPDAGFIEVFPPDIIEETSVKSKDFYLNLISPLAALYPELSGTAVAVSVKELNADPNDPDLTGRIRLIDPAVDQSDHTTAMASLIGGSGATSYFGRGVAPGVRILCTGNPQIPDSIPVYAEYGISVQNHSYGATDFEPYYGVRSAGFDATVNALPYLLHVMSAGNKGDTRDESTEYLKRGFGNITGSFKTAKNILVVGAQNNDGSIAGFSSRGPAFDGRLLPHLVAHGQGASEAAALVSGLSLLLQEQYRRLHDNRLPPADLIKSALIAASDDAGPAGPDFKSGYGAVNGLKSMAVISTGNFIIDSLEAEGESMDFMLQVPAGAEKLKVSLVWNDPAAAPLAATALVNDLDLTLTTPAGQTILPWTLNPHPDSLEQPARRGADHLNNAEWITLDQPGPGQYKLVVKATRLQQGTAQSFSISWSFDRPEDARWVFPDRRNPLVGRSVNALTWRATATAEPAALEWSPDLGQTWRTIAAGVSPAAQRFFWETPDTLCPALLRLRSNAGNLVSDTFFIAPACKLQTGYRCGDSLELRWTDLGPGFRYQLQVLENGEMTPWKNTSLPYLTADANELNGKPVAVLPVHQTVHAGLHRSPLLYGPEAFSAPCYLVDFRAEVREGSIRLTIELNSTRGIARLVIRQSDDSSILFWEKSDPDPDAFFIEIPDPNPYQGVNVYRLEIYTDQSPEPVSAIASAIFSGEHPYLLFPNPADSRRLIYLIDRKGYFDAGTRLEIRDLTGRLVYRSGEIDAYPFPVALPELSHGLYVYAVYSGGAISDHGRLFIQK
ncbi:MAG: S8 family serine peptidase [Lewinellaceae bacterium]|nr:S8 family serine peptidase [Lewinellaceae bacterium]